MNRKWFTFYFVKKGELSISSIAQYRKYLWDYLERNHHLKNPKQFFHCLNPEHPDNNPSMMYTSKYEICHCFSCGVNYDIFDLVGLDYNIDNFRDQLLKIEELYLGYVPINKVQNKNDNVIHDYTKYFNWCKKNISKTDYLQNRGITDELINKYNVGYDEKRNLVVFPINKNCYFGRSTVNNDKVKNPGYSDIWNRNYIKDSGENTLIYVTEGIIDALSLEVIDPNIKAISINGVGNINSLIQVLKDEKYNGYLVIVFDNDFRGIKASNLLKEELTKINVNSFSNTLISNFGADVCTDLNNALTTNKDKLKANYEYANTAYMQYIEKNKNKEEGIEIE